jgi:glycosyltransferase involved in cell wall biosynthesis
MKLGPVLVAGAATIAVARVAGKLARQRAELRSVDRQRGDIVRANALAAIDAALRHPVTEPEIAIVIAALDEEEAIADVLAALPTDLCGYRVTPIVIVDGGTDDTAGVVARAGHVTVRHEVNRGQGDALCTGFALALERGSSIVVTMDADGQHRPEELPLLLEPILAGDADYVQGSRYLGAYEDQGGARDIGIRAFTALINTASGANITDCTNGFRAIRSDPLARLRLEEPRFSAAELLMESARQNLRIREVPVHIRSRSHGESKKPQRMAYPLGYLGTIVRTWRRSVGRAPRA